METTVEPTLEHLSPFTVAGISARTINSDEGNPATSKLGPLWNRFYSEGIMKKIAGALPGSPVYGVYADYESDFNGHYTTTAGVKVNAGAQGDGMREVHVEGGDYLVFTKRGTLPAIVVETWGDVWRYFAGSHGYARRYTTDFEEYTDGSSVSIYIAVTKVEER
jgi:predicted transcriptional regulator YdeE